MRRVALVIVAAGLMGCTTIYRRYEFEQKLAMEWSRGGCPASQVSITARGGEMVEGTDLPVHVRVEGCRRQQDYVVKASGYAAVPDPADIAFELRQTPECGTTYEGNWPHPAVRAAKP